jgi:hypothetical protein
MKLRLFVEDGYHLFTTLGLKDHSEIAVQTQRNKIIHIGSELRD